jgi:hypothetical protein
MTIIIEIQREYISKCFTHTQTHWYGPILYHMMDPMGKWMDSKMMFYKKTPTFSLFDCSF